MKFFSYLKSLVPYYGSGFRFKVMLYKREFYRKHNLWFLASCLRAKFIKRYGFDINERASVSPKVNIMHPVGIVIGEGVIIEENVTIYQGVCLGRNKIDELGYPIVKKGTVLYAHSMVIGKVIIEENCVIGSYSLVKCNCDANSVFVGIPARKVK